MPATWRTGRMEPTLVSHPTIAAIAHRAGATPAQVLLSWAVQRGTSVVPKSEDEERMRKNIDVSAPSVSGWRVA